MRTLIISNEVQRLRSYDRISPFQFTEKCVRTLNIAYCYCSLFISQYVFEMDSLQINRWKSVAATLLCEHEQWAANTVLYIVLGTNQMQMIFHRTLKMVFSSDRRSEKKHNLIVFCFSHNQHTRIWHSRIWMKMKNAIKKSNFIEGHKATTNFHFINIHNFDGTSKTSLSLQITCAIFRYVRCVCVCWRGRAACGLRNRKKVYFSKNTHAFVSTQR